MLEEKLVEAKVIRRKKFIILVITFVTISLLSAAVVFFTSCCQTNPDQINPDETGAIFPDLAKEIEKTIEAVSPEQSRTVPQATPQAISDEQLRQSYIDALNDYENNIKPELNKIDLARWDLKN